MRPQTAAAVDRLLDERAELIDELTFMRQIAARCADAVANMTPDNIDALIQLHAVLVELSGAPSPRSFNLDGLHDAVGGCEE